MQHACSAFAKETNNFNEPQSIFPCKRYVQHPANSSCVTSCKFDMCNILQIRHSIFTMQNCTSNIVQILHVQIRHMQPARPYGSCKIFKGRPRRNAFSKLVHRQYKSLPPDRFCQVEMKNPTRLSIKTNNA